MLERGSVGSQSESSRSAEDPPPRWGRAGSALTAAVAVIVAALAFLRAGPSTSSDVLVAAPPAVSPGPPSPAVSDAPDADLRSPSAADARHEEVAPPAAPPEAPSDAAAAPAVGEAAHPFLPPELEVLGFTIPASLDQFERASRTEQLHSARELLVHSIAVIQCARGDGPFPRGAPGHGDLSLAGQEGRWSFQVNDRTFHLRESEFPEYGEYIALLRSAYDDEMVLASTTIELPEPLAERIRLRALEALSWL